MRAHLQAAEEQTGSSIDELHPDPPPQELEYLWEWAVELSAGWQVGMSMPQFYSELGWWARLMRHSLKPWEVKTLYRLYLTALAVAAEKHS